MYTNNYLIDIIIEIKTCQNIFSAFFHSHHYCYYNIELSLQNK